MMSKSQINFLFFAPWFRGVLYFCGLCRCSNNPYVFHMALTYGEHRPITCVQCLHLSGNTVYAEIAKRMWEAR